MNEEALETEVGTPRANPKSRMMVLSILLNVVLFAGLLYKSFGDMVPSNTGVTLALINYTPGPMLDVAFEYPGGKLAVPTLGIRDQVGHSIPNLVDFEATLSFKDEQGHSFKQVVPVVAYGGMLTLLGVQSVFETSVVKTAEGKEEAVVKASPDKVFVVKSYQKPGWGK